MTLPPGAVRRLPAAVLGLSVLALAGCGLPLADGGEVQEQAAGFTGCIVSDEGGFQDRSFHESTRSGLQAARASLGIEVREAESQVAADLEPGLVAMVQAGCDVTVAAGHRLAAATQTVAAAEPSTKFVVVDDATVGLPNVKPLVFDTAGAAFLAGYVAAGSTRTGTVAAYGGMDVAPVRVILDGFADGIAHYNETEDAEVRLLGWDRDSQEGTFVGDFSDTSGAATITRGFVADGADVVLPVAGEAALGTVDAVVEANTGGDEVRFVWVDADGHRTLEKGKEYQLTSVLKQLSTSVQDAVESAARGEFSNEPYVGTLENGGVGIAPYHDQEDAVGEELADAVEQLEQDVIDGTVPVASESSPSLRPAAPAASGRPGTKE
ncbi:BMP family ABC transporter substrate-binding protein [Kocuria flava]|uniref:BMP family lipoprotein n=1 Tax=Kocuria flava TaxID=446860 RepID=UPI001FF15919|nr:BMP family ABC transporter substrate-binding protein [Kocuria flava]MCJ8504502.1 BMP family ABC transporter substrate-binding protein [Kocuria flava]